ncbi:MAG TPA: DsbA family oxidoreductase [Pseudonocardiaceae bacterium]|jgi:predicted DsbA family dithiol-disulfide isomerase
MQVEIYSDVACPWCYVGKTRFERALAAFPGAGDVDVSYRPYQLNPTTPTQAQPLYEYYDTLFGPGFRDKHSQVVDIAKAEGLDFRFDQALAVNTFTAHRLLWLTERDYGAAVQRDLKAALLRAYFTDGRDVGDTDTLVDIAAGVGVAAERARTWLTGTEGVLETQQEIDHARQLGIQAVPTFVFNGKYAVQGAQEASTFLRVLEEVAADAAAAEVPEGAADTGSDGACADGSCAV